MSSNSPWRRRAPILAAILLMLISGPGGRLDASTGKEGEKQAAIHPCQEKGGLAKEADPAPSPSLRQQTKKAAKELSQALARSGREVLHSLRQSGRETAEALRRSGQQIHKAWCQAARKLATKMKRDLTDPPRRE